jgi:hypothetical protein
MGKTAFAGPVYGAKSLLWTYGPYADVHSTGASTGLLNTNAVRVVPSYEDWYITEVAAYTSTNSTAAGHGIYLKSEGGSTTGIVRLDGVSTVSQTLASFTTGASSVFTGSTTVAATAGEYEGKWVPAGSTLRIVSSGVSVAGNVQLQVMGYIRFVDSTRAV